MTRVALIGRAERLADVERMLRETSSAELVPDAGTAHVWIVDLPSGVPHLEECTADRVVAIADGPRASSMISSPIDVMMWRPVSPSAVRVAAGLDGRIRPSRATWSEILELSTLTVATDEGLPRLGRRLADAFGVSQAIVAIDASNDRFRGTVQRTLPSSVWYSLDHHLRAVASVGTTVIAGQPGGGDKSYLVAPLSTPHHQDHGGLCLVADEARVFTRQETRALSALARRISLELTWTAVYDRIVDEVDRLRDSPRLDPRLSVWNRPALERMTTKHIALAARLNVPLTVAVLDVVGLEEINKTWGHPAGDAVLQHVAHAARLGIRDSDIVGHYCDDELAILYPATTVEQARSAIERIRERMSRSPVRMPDGERISPDLRVGFTRSAPDRDDASALLDRAARATRDAQRRGRPWSEKSSRSLVSGRSSSVRHESVEPATTLGGTYRLLHEISRGAMGVIYRAEDLGLGRAVAVKMLRPDFGGDRGFLERFRSEAAILAQLRHPNLVEVYSFGIDGDDAYFVMELIEGRTLTDEIDDLRARKDVPDLAHVQAVTRQMASALNALHGRGVIHRDVKPDNIVLDPFRNRAVLIDVGIAHRHGDQSAAVGTPGFVAPEVLDEDEPSERSDIYGLAATIYTMIALEPPWGETGTALDVIKRQRTETPRPLAHLGAGLDALDDVLVAALSPRPTDRPSSASLLAEAIDAAIEPAVAPARERSSRARPHARPSLRPNDIFATATTSSEVFSRGILFRTIPRVIGVRSAHAWRLELTDDQPELAAVLATDLSPLGWQPTRLLLELLALFDRPDRHAAELAAELGRATIRSSFRRLFPASAATLAPAPTLNVFDSIWSRYHGWGRVTVMPMEAMQVGVRIEETPRDELMCAWTIGALRQLVTLAGGREVEVTHERCEARDDRDCVFRVDWTEQG